MTIESENGRLIYDYLKRGQIVPVTISLNLLKAAMKATPCYRYLIDGFPRNWDNLQGWQKEMEDVCELDTVLFIECNQQELERRILDRGSSSGRSDDNLETALKRFRTFERETMPIVEHFSACKDSPLVRIDGTKTVEEVFDAVKGAMSLKIQKDVLRSAAAMTLEGTQTTHDRKVCRAVLLLSTASVSVRLLGFNNCCARVVHFWISPTWSIQKDSFKVTLEGKEARLRVGHQVGLAPCLPYVRLRCVSLLRKNRSLLPQLILLSFPDHFYSGRLLC
jgi:UMP-CMP kinase